MQKAVSYARVSSKEQELGFSLESQVNTYTGYAASNAFLIVKEFKFSESAKQQGRKHFNEMLDFLRRNRDVRVVLVEKTDRLSRNLHDFVMVEDLVEELGIEIHLIKEGQVLRKASKSQDRLVQGIFALLARNYIQNMQEEILKGQLVKAEKGQYPGRAMFGYSHDRETRTIVAHPTRTGVVKLIFELYSTGQYSADTLRKEIIKQTGEKISKSRLHEILKSRFYLGFFTWRGREYQGIHPPLVDSITFKRVQDIISGRNGIKDKTRKHHFPFSGMLTCAADGCAITAEIAKQRYVYYRCSYGRGKHKFPPFSHHGVTGSLRFPWVKL
jgi:DNA invertase Pin-like site-specific DNA recombinase